MISVGRRRRSESGEFDGWINLAPAIDNSRSDCAEREEERIFNIYVNQCCWIHQPQILRWKPPGRASISPQNVTRSLLKVIEEIVTCLIFATVVWRHQMEATWWHLQIDSFVEPAAVVRLFPVIKDYFSITSREADPKFKDFSIKGALN